MKGKGRDKAKEKRPSKSVIFHGVPIVSTGEGFQWGLFAAGDTAVGIVATGRIAVGVLASGAIAIGRSMVLHSTSASKRSSWAMASCCATIPPNDSPTTTAFSNPRESMIRNASTA